MRPPELETGSEAETQDQLPAVRCVRSGNTVDFIIASTRPLGHKRLDLFMSADLLAVLESLRPEGYALTFVEFQGRETTVRFTKMAE